MSGWSNLADFIGLRQTWPRSKILNQNICLVHLNSSRVCSDFFLSMKLPVDKLIQHCQTKSTFCRPKWQQKCKLFHSFIFPRALEINVEMWGKRRLFLKVPYLFFLENLIRIVSKGNILSFFFFVEKEKTIKGTKYLQPFWHFYFSIFKQWRKVCILFLNPHMPWFRI